MLELMKIPGNIRRVVCVAVMILSMPGISLGLISPTVVYTLRFMNTSDSNEAIRLASQGYFGDRQAEGQSFYLGANPAPPSGPIASFSHGGF